MGRFYVLFYFSTILRMIIKLTPVSLEICRKERCSFLSF